MDFEDGKEHLLTNLSLLSNSDNIYVNLQSDIFPVFFVESLEKILYIFLCTQD